MRKLKLAVMLALAAGLCAPVRCPAADAAPEKKPPQGEVKKAGARDILRQHLADLQKSPGDRALREKIIVLASGLTPPPAVPAEAKRPFFKAATFFKEAKDNAGFDLAIKSYKEALLLAPWWAEANYNLAQAQESAPIRGPLVNKQ